MVNELRISRVVPLLLVVSIVLGAGSWLRSLPPPQRDVRRWSWAKTRTVALYFSDGRFLFPVSRHMPSTDDLPRTVLEALLAGPSPTSGLTSPIPRRTELRSIKLEDGVVQVDLSAPGLRESSDINSAVTAIVETLTALPDVHSVAISVDGKPLIPSAKRVPLLYYASANGLVSIPTSATTPRDAISDLMDHSPDPSLTSIPPDVRLLNYEHNAANGLLSLNFTYTPSIRALALDMPDRMRTVLLGLVTTLTEFSGVRMVQIDFEGRSRLGVGQCSDLLHTPQAKPELLNDERLLGR